MSDSGSSGIRFCSKGCKTRLVKLSLDPHTSCFSCRGQKCSADLTCNECELLTLSDWSALGKYMKKLERDRIRKASSRSSRSGGSQEVFVNPIIPAPPVVPVVLPTPDTVSPNPDTVSVLNAFMSSMQKMGDNLQRLVDRSDNTSVVPCVSVVEEVASRPIHAPRSRPLSGSQVPGRRHAERR